MLSSCADSKANILRRICDLSRVGCDLAYLGNGLSTADAVCIAESCQGRSCFSFKEYCEDVWELWWISDSDGVHHLTSRHWDLALAAELRRITGE